MYLANRLRELRVVKNLSQGDIEERTGLLRCYVSRVENGHTVPSVETLEKFARALEVPMYQLFYGSEESPEIPTVFEGGKTDWASRGTGRRVFGRLRKLLRHMAEQDRVLLFHMARAMTSTKHRRNGK